MELKKIDYSSFKHTDITNDELEKCKFWLEKATYKEDSSLNIIESKIRGVDMLNFMLTKTKRPLTTETISFFKENDISIASVNKMKDDLLLKRKAMRKEVLSEIKECLDKIKKAYVAKRWENEEEKLFLKIFSQFKLKSDSNGGTIYFIKNNVKEKYVSWNLAYNMTRAFSSEIKGPFYKMHGEFSNEIFYAVEDFYKKMFIKYFNVPTNTNWAVFLGMMDLDGSVH